jgi:UDPglucose 6-dehydrogenase
MEAVRRLLGDGIEYSQRHYEACDGADALIIVTEWNKFREPDFNYMRELLKEPVIFDGRNVYELDTMQGHGFTYYSIGRPNVQPLSASS